MKDAPPHDDSGGGTAAADQSDSDDRRLGRLNLSRETVGGTAAKFSQAVAGFVGTIVFAQELGPAAYGGFYLILSASNLVDQPLDGTRRAVQKRFSETGAARGDIFGTSLLAWLGWGGVTTLGAYLGRGFLADYSGVADAWLLFVGLYMTLTLFNFHGTLLKGAGSVAVAMWIDTVRSYLTLGLQLALVLAGLGVVGMAAGLVGATVLVIPVAVYALGTRPTVPSRPEIGHVWTYARYSIPARFSGKTYDELDLLLLGLLASQVAAGNYRAAAALTLPGAFVNEAASSAFLARTSHQATAEHSEESTVIADLTNTMSFTSVLSIPIVFGAAAVPGVVFATVGDQYTTAPTYLLGLALYRMIRTYDAPLQEAINGIDRPDLDMRVSLAVLGVNVVVGVGLVMTVGPVGVIVATVLSESLRAAAFAYFVRREIGAFPIVPEPLGEQFRAAAVMFVVVLIAKEPVRQIPALELGTTPVTAGLVLLGGVVYVAVLVATSELFRLAAVAAVEGTRLESLVESVVSRFE